MKLFELIEDVHDHPLKKVGNPQRKRFKSTRGSPEEAEGGQLKLKTLMKPVAAFIRRKGYATFDEITAFVEREWKLSERDVETQGHGKHWERDRYISTITNFVNSHRKVTQEYPDLVRVRGLHGYATQKYADDHNMELLDPPATSQYTK